MLEQTVIHTNVVQRKGKSAIYSSMLNCHVFAVSQAVSQSIVQLKREREAINRDLNKSMREIEWKANGERAKTLNTSESYILFKVHSPLPHIQTYFTMKISSHDSIMHSLHAFIGHVVVQIATN